MHYSFLLSAMLLFASASSISAEEKSVNLSSANAHHEKDADWVDYVPKEYQHYIPKHAKRHHKARHHKDGDSSWEKYRPKNGHNHVPWTEDLNNDHKDQHDSHLLEASQESFSWKKDHKGHAHLFQCSFKNDFAVDRLDASQCSFKNLHVRGKATLRESSIQGNGMIEGTLSVRTLSIHGNLAVKGPNIRIISSNIQGDLLISDSADHPATVYLDTTTIEGNIHFKSGKGTLLTKGKVTIEGQVSGVS